MMKKIIIYAITLLSFCSCQDDNIEDIFDKSPDARAAEKISELKDALTASENGWITYYGANNKIGKWIVLLKFETDGTVKIQTEPVDVAYAGSDYRYPEAFDNTVTYGIQHSQGTDLVFESECIFSRWNKFQYNGVSYRYDLEFQFTLENVSDEGITFKSKTDMGPDESVTRLVLKKATPEDWNTKPITQVNEKLPFFNVDKGNFMRLTENGQLLEYNVAITPDRVLTFAYAGADGIKQEVKRPFTVNRSGIELLSPIQVGTKTLSGFKIDANDSTRWYTNDLGGNAAMEYSNVPASFEDFPYVDIWGVTKTSPLRFDFYRRGNKTSDAFYEMGQKIRGDVSQLPADQMRMYDLYLNNNDEQSEEPNAFVFEYVIPDPDNWGSEYSGDKFQVSIPVTITKKAKKSVSFKLRDGVNLVDCFSTLFTDREKAREQAELVTELLNVLTNEQGWYIVTYQNFGQFFGFISVADPEKYRFEADYARLN